MVAGLVDIADDYVRLEKLKQKWNGALMREEEMGHSSGEKPSAVAGNDDELSIMP